MRFAPYLPKSFRSVPGRMQPPPNREYALASERPRQLEQRPSLSAAIGSRAIIDGCHTEAFRRVSQAPAILALILRQVTAGFIKSDRAQIAVAASEQKRGSGIRGR